MADFDAQIFEKEMQREAEAIRLAPADVQGRESVRAARNGLGQVLTDIETNPTKFEGSTGSGQGGP